MSFSLNEIEAMGKRAARGAGLSWGLCEEAAKGVRWLSSFGFPGPDLLANLLEQNDRLPHIDFTPVSLEGEWHAPANRLSPLIAGAAMSDCAIKMERGETICMHNVSYPLLLAPFAAGAALRLEAPVTVKWGGARITTDGAKLGTSGTQEELMAKSASILECTIATDIALPIKPVSRAQIDEQTWKRLETFAARTFAPATEESRLRGAGGAELTDND